MKKFKHIKAFPFFESLYISDDISNILFNLRNDDKVADFLQNISDSIYKDKEDINFIDLSDEFNKFSFVPHKRRKSNDDHYEVFDQKSMPTRIGKLVNKIWSRVKQYTEYEITTQAFIEINSLEDGGNISSLVFPLLKDQEEIQFLFSNKVSSREHWRPGKIEFKIKGVYDSNDKLKKEEQQYSGDLIFVRTRYLNYGWIDTKDISNRRATCIDFVPDNNFELLKELSTTDEDNLKLLEVKIKLKSNVHITDSDVELFVNKVVAFIKANSAAPGTKVEIVEGEDIRFWYNEDNYKNSETGELANSCMSYTACQKYFDIYVKNPDKVKMAILKSQDNKLLARALVWRLENGHIFVDRTYSTLNSDALIIINWAKENGYYYKMNGQIYKKSKKIENKDIMAVELSEWKFHNYPYLDTLKFLDPENGKLYAEIDDEKPHVGKFFWLLNDVSGDYNKAGFFPLK